MYWELGWDDMGRGARWWLGYGADLDQRPWERQSRQTLQMRWACGSAHVHQLKVHGSYGAAERFTKLEFHMQTSNSRVRPTGAVHTPGSGKSRMTKKKNYIHDENRPFLYTLFLSVKYIFPHKTDHSQE